MSESKVPVGSVGYWAAMRLAQFLIICIGLLFLVGMGRPFPWQRALILLLWFLFAVYLDSSVYGFADEHGVVAGELLFLPRFLRILRPATIL